MLPRVRTIVRRLGIPEHGRDYEDLVQEGMVAALKAAESYDPHRDTAYSTWAETKVQGSLVDYLRRQDRTRARDGARHAHVIPLEAAGGGAERRADGDVRSLHEVVPDHRAEAELDDVLEAMHAHERDGLEEAILRLPERQTFVIACSFWRGMRGGEIARSLGISGPRVSQLRKEALHRLRGDHRVQAFAHSYFARADRRAA
jgi:RNA polymerase sigma factor FliA